jgi:hypothetical protein
MFWSFQAVVPIAGRWPITPFWSEQQTFAGR